MGSLLLLQATTQFVGRGNTVILVLLCNGAGLTGSEITKKKHSSVKLKNKL